MEIASTTSLRELAFIVCTVLEREGTTAVLSGGSAATIYSAEAYSSRDLDFVLTFGGSNSSKPLSDLGYKLRNHFYEHPNTTFTLDFPPGPLMIGSDVDIEWDTLHDDEERVLHIIKPTDSVLDRLVAYVHWKERASLVSAATVAVAIGDDLDWDRIESWCEHEGATAKIKDLQKEMARWRE